jgi:hypothetical protein
VLETYVDLRRALAQHQLDLIFVESYDLDAFVLAVACKPDRIKQNAVRISFNHDHGQSGLALTKLCSGMVLPFEDMQHTIKLHDPLPVPIVNEQLVQAVTKIQGMLSWPNRN